MSSTIRLHRVLRATPERVYRAFLDSEARAFYHAVRGRHNFCRINSSLHPPSSNRFSAQVVRCYRLPDKPLRGMVADHYCSGVPASAIPYNCLVRVSTKWIDSFQVVYMSAYRAGKG